MIYSLMAAAIAYPTWFFGWPALVEVWNHGYASGLDQCGTARVQPDHPVLSGRGGPGMPLDFRRRIDFNLFLRFVSVSLGFFLILAATGFSVEAIASRAVAETWSSLIATPLSGRRILRAKLLATFWRFRLGIGTLVDALDARAGFTGAIHPLGFVLSLMVLLCLDLAVDHMGTADCAQSGGCDPGIDPEHGADHALARVRCTPVALCPAGLNSVLIGSGCSPFVLWLSQLSYRDSAQCLAVRELSSPFMDRARDR